jgi:hypothetical protein
LRIVAKQAIEGAMMIGYGHLAQHPDKLAARQESESLL